MKGRIINPHSVVAEMLINVSLESGAEKLRKKRQKILFAELNVGGC